MLATQCDTLGKKETRTDSMPLTVLSQYIACVLGAVVVLGCLFLTWWSREREELLNPKWTKAYPNSSVERDWNRARTIANQSEAGSGVSNDAGSIHTTMGWR